MTNSKFPMPNSKYANWSFTLAPPRFLLNSCCTRYWCSVRAKLAKKIIAGVGAIAALTSRLVFTNENIAVDLRSAAKKFR